MARILAHLPAARNGQRFMAGRQGDEPCKGDIVIAQGVSPGYGRHK